MPLDINSIADLLESQITLNGFDKTVSYAKAKTFIEVEGYKVENPRNLIEQTLWGTRQVLIGVHG